MKALKEAIELLKFFKDRKNTKITTMIKVQSCIAELEALQQPKSCYDCKHWFPNKASYPCNQCSMAINCLFEPKEQ